MKNLFALMLLCWSVKLFAYVATRTEYDQKLVWNTRAESLDIYIDPNPLNAYRVQSLTSQKVESILAEVIEHWSLYSPYDLDYVFTANLPTLGTSRTIRFTDNTGYFGSGILALTSVSHSAATGEIYSADILLNATMSNTNIFTDNPSDSGGNQAFLGDVVSHELGHFLGLGHSDVFGSTMLYSVFKNQMTIHSDDISGLYYLYNRAGVATTLDDKGVISGRVIAAENQAVFGAQVQAISYKTGKVVAGVLTEADGKFKIELLPQGDSYLIYVLPPRNVDNLPIYYASIQSKYCFGNNYVPSFFTKCGARSRGRPQVLSLKGQESLDIGSITIRCDENLDSNYLFAKSEAKDYILHETLYHQTPQQIGQTFVGYFSQNDISQELTGSGDLLKIDLTGFEYPGEGEYSLNVKVVTEDIGTSTGVYAEIYNYNNELVGSEDLSIGDNGVIDTMLEFSLTLSSSSPSENLYYLKLLPRGLSPTQKLQLFANPVVMTNKNSTYLVLTSLFKNGIPIGFKNSQPYEDNYYCTEGNDVVTAKPNVYSSLNNDFLSIGNEGDAPSCGTVDFKSDGGGPGLSMMSFSIGLMLSIAFAFVRRKSYDFFV